MGVLKRTFDIVLSCIGLVILGPILLITIPFARLETGGSGIFRQSRIGQEQRTFNMYKIRTMRKGTKEQPTHEVTSDCVGIVGRFLRRSKLDEVPQLINVLMGDMSLVGPRPCLACQTKLIEARSRTGAFRGKPGITGIGQVRKVDMSKPAALAKIDGEYVASASLMLDFSLILATFIAPKILVNSIDRQVKRAKVRQISNYLQLEQCNEQGRFEKDPLKQNLVDSLSSLNTEPSKHA